MEISDEPDLDLGQIKAMIFCVAANRPDAQVSVSKDVPLWSVSPP